MSNSTKQSLPKYLAILAVSFTLAACGGGGGGGSSDATTEEDTVFSVQVVNIDARRASNGEAVTVDTAALSTGTLTYE